MAESERALAAPESANWLDKLSRELGLKVLGYAQHGHLTLVEQGEVIGEYGHAEAEPRARIEVHHPRMFRRFLFDGDIGAGESFTDGDWSSPDLLAVIRFFAANLQAMDKISARFGWITWPFQKLSYLTRGNNKKQARKNIISHYDLGNDLYTRFLDQRMQYSSAIYPHPQANLEEAQQEKLHRLCQMLDLQPDDHLLEIGTGWGGLAIFAAQEYGCKVTTTTISDAQFDYAKERVDALGLSQQITLLKQDYRDLEGRFDKLVSVEMIEAVGEKYLPGFFRKCSDLLKENGRLVIQAITIADQRAQAYNRDVDFIQRHIFPGGYLPSIELMSRLLKSKTDLVLRELDDIGLDYAKTLSDWRQRFNSRRSELNGLGYDDRFFRLWNYYLCYCEGGFSERRVSAVQFTATKPADKGALRKLTSNA
ncbi:SAM-dependent methyltransferase [Aliidiomarina minuta]|uniref:SAM-dependent methyltransferase n=1 Tax=Aliidiomarina minuta TaxID=880057 RepID=A0A432W6F6_9GAMM|nr:cyclopropane-fatty-acyl-phospholipid synthase family protein [Aliidiomarina minuta]RUO25601.1 SAM-dependent methyltransferase [Aliidiomarina minuta]